MSEISIRINKQLLLDLMVTAFEGGSNYWLNDVAQASDVVRDDDLNYLSATFTFREEVTPTVKEGTVLVVTPQSMRTGLERMAASDSRGVRRHLADALGQDGDATTADVVLQFAMFGELVFG